MNSDRTEIVASNRKYILWDNDGVLVDTEYWYFQATRETIAELGINLELELYLRRMVHGQSSWDLALAQGVSEKTVIATRLARDARYQHYLQEKNIEVPGVLHILDILSRHYRMAIVTTSKRKDFDVIHRNRGIIDYMDFVLVREDYEFSKPNPEPYQLALEKFDAQPHECLVIEDSQRGLKAAVAAGIDCAVVYNEFTASQDFCAATFHVQSLAELPGILGVMQDQQ
ncbi:MAG: HAD superfamily hydrolase (TIGR01509 family) [Bacteroidia bacterium]|jgi:HAD superfamily hydrolase (TIGR01509 family)